MKRVCFWSAVTIINLVGITAGASLVGAWLGEHLGKAILDVM